MTRHALLLVLAALGCARDESPDTPGADGAATDLAAAGDSAVRCFKSPNSILGRHIASSDPVSRSAPVTGTGWVKLMGPTADSGEARLVDEDGSALGATWRRGAGDTVLVTGFDDFLRVELRMTHTDGAATGSAVATSDASLERDSTGTLREMRRAWSLTAHRAPCDSMPTPAQPHLR